MNPIRAWWIAAAWLAAVGMAQAAMYKWVDENGVTQYTQYPPPNREVEVVVPPPPPATDRGEAQQKLEATLQKLEEQRKAREEAEAEQAQSAPQAELRRKNCQAARANLEKLTTGGRKRVTGADGVAYYQTEEERQANIAKAKEQIKEFCD